MTETPHTPLLPCPFCGGEAMLAKKYVWCKRCGAEGAVAEPISKAITAWNTRATPLPTTANNPETDAHRDLVAWSDVIAERRRQMEQEGYTPAHDDEHDRDHALARAAACYALAGTDAGSGPFWITRLQTPKQVWPYRWEWKPSDTRRNLVKAAALLLAEIERIDRAALTKAEVTHG